MVVVVVVVQSLGRVWLFATCGLWPAGLLRPWHPPGKGTGVGCHALLQGGLPDPRIQPVSPALAGRFFTVESPKKWRLELNTITYSFFFFFPLPIWQASTMDPYLNSNRIKAFQVSLSEY